MDNRFYVRSVPFRFVSSFGYPFVVERYSYVTHAWIYSDAFKTEVEAMAYCVKLADDLIERGRVICMKAEG